MGAGAKRRFRLFAAIAASVTLIATATVPVITSAADHLDAPALNPGRLDADINDLYVFTGADPNATVLAMTVSPAAGAIGPATFGTDVLYQFNIVDPPLSDVTNFAADIAYRATFGTPGASGQQSFTLYKGTGADADGLNTSGTAVASGFTGQIAAVGGGGQFFAGLRSDPFFFDFGGFLGSVEGASNGRMFNDGNESDFFQDLNVLALVLELPDSALPPQGGGLNDGIAVWASTGVKNNGGFDQVDRIGRPAINTVVNSIGVTGSKAASDAAKDAFNAGHPEDDTTNFEQAVKDALIALSSIDPADSYSEAEALDLASVLLPDKLFFDKASPPFPPFNGRRLFDDVIDIELDIVTQGDVNTDGIGPHSDYLDVFPYLGEPHLAPPAPPPKPATVGVVDQDQGLWYLVDPILADLSGDSEVPPGSGDPNGSGRGQVTFNKSAGRVCFDLDLNNLQGTVAAAHIHDGAAGANGPVVVDFDLPNNGTSGCVPSTSTLIDQILADLDAFYVNVHSDMFPAGAVRGQLGGGPLPPFFFGDPNDDPFLGDWDGDGVPTPGVFRPSGGDAGTVLLRNSNDAGPADIEFVFGNPDDIPVIGDWDGDGDDTVSLYRPSEGKVFITNKLGSGNQGLGAAEIEFIFGDPGDDPFAGDFDDDGKDTVGVKRGNVFYWRNSLSTGTADNGNGLIFGDLNDEPMFGDWDGDGLETPGVYRPSNGTIFLRNLQTPGISDMEIFTDGFESGDTSAWSTGR